MNRRPDLSLALLNAFATLASELHFGRAAATLGTAQPALSQQIRRVEGILGCQLLERDTRNVRLTPAGVVLHKLAERILIELRNGLEHVRRAGRGEAGRLVIGFTATTALRVLPLVIEEQRASSPDVELELVELLPDDLCEGLANGRLDAGLARELIGRSDIHSVTLAQEPYVAVLPSALAAGLPPDLLPLSSLRDQPFILFPSDSSSANSARVLEMCAAAGIAPRAVQTAPGWQTAVSLVGVGLGVTLLPECTRSLALPNVVYRSVDSAVRSHIMIVRRVDDDRPLVDNLIVSALRAFGHFD